MPNLRHLGRLKEVQRFGVLFARPSNHFNREIGSGAYALQMRAYALQMRSDTKFKPVPTRIIWHGPFSHCLPVSHRWSKARRRQPLGHVWAGFGSPGFADGLVALGAKWEELSFLGRRFASSARPLQAIRFVGNGGFYDTTSCLRILHVGFGRLCYYAANALRFLADTTASGTARTVLNFGQTTRLCACDMAAS